MRIGLIGGTYNPIHNGHLRIAEEIREEFALDRVVFIPAAVPPHKLLANDLSFEHRLAMVAVAIAENPFFDVSSLEGDRGGKSYSIDTLRHFREAHPQDELFFIMGSDSFVDIASWKEAEKLFDYANIVVVDRPGFLGIDLAEALPVAMTPLFWYHPEEKMLRHQSGNSVYYRQGVPLDISSSAIRRLVRQGRSVKYLVPPVVEHYIKENRLYAKC